MTTLKTEGIAPDQGSNWAPYLVLDQDFLASDFSTFQHLWSQDRDSYISLRTYQHPSSLFILSYSILLCAVSASHQAQYITNINTAIVTYNHGASLNATVTYVWLVFRANSKTLLPKLGAGSVVSQLRGLGLWSTFSGVML